MNIKPFHFLLASFSLLISSTQAAEEGHGSGASADGVAPASDDGKKAISSFKFDEGLKCELWAAEPMVANPVAFTQDEKGRWFVAETFRQEKGVEDNRNHNSWLDEDIASKSVEDRLAMMHKAYPDTLAFNEKFAKYEDRIRRLEDSTGSGLANKVTVYADGFRDPLDGTGAGILARGNDLWWTCIPNLWHFRDTNDDGVADEKEKQLTGFGTKFALRGHDMHGLRFGPDGKLYFTIGDRGLKVKTKEGQDIEEHDAGAIMRCNPDGSGFEIVCTGMRNPQELAFDEHGNLFTCDNNCDAGDGSRFTYLVEGGDCGWRMAYQYLSDRGPWMRERPWDAKIAPSVRYIIPCIMNVSAGPSGITYNPGTGLSEKYNGKFYLSDFRGGAGASVVYEIGTQPKGASFSAASRDWVKGILTTDVEFGNDGSLYVLDWVASWGGVGKGRIYKFTDPKANVALQKETEKLIGEGMTKRQSDELARLLSHPDMRVRQAAQFELDGRGMDSAKLFAGIAADTKVTNPLARLHAIWGLGQLSAKNVAAVDSLPALLSDADAEVRAQAVKVLGDAKVVAASGKLVELLKDKENRVRFFAALSLGKIGFKPAFEPLCAMLTENNDADPILRHGGVMGLVGCATPEQIATKLKDPSVGLRGAAVVALRRFMSPLIASFLKDTDESIVLEVARAIHDVPIQEAMPALAELTTNKEITNPHILSRAINAHYRLGGTDHAKALAAFAADTASPEASRKDALDALAIWAKPDGKDRLLGMWRPIPDRDSSAAVAAVAPVVSALLKDSPAKVQEATAKLTTKLSLTGAGDALFALASNPQAGELARIESIRALASLKDAHLPQIAKVAVNDPSAKIRTEGLQALAGSDPQSAIEFIGDIIKTGTVIEKQGGLLALGQMQSTESDAMLSGLLDQLAENKLPTEIQLDVVEAARKHKSAALKTKVAKYEASFPPADELAKWRFALTGGDAERGRKIFREKPETQCLRCHICEAGDSLVGPDLTHVGATKDRTYILESILYPSKMIAENFETVMVILKDGNGLVGRLAGQDATVLKVDTLDVLTGKQKLVTVPVADINQRDSMPSPMPPNLGDLLTKAELRDLVEYLATRK
ncbi:c-type cytochrome [soil metagenome]